MSALETYDAQAQAERIENLLQGAWELLYQGHEEGTERTEEDIEAARQIIDAAQRTARVAIDRCMAATRASFSINPAVEKQPRRRATRKAVAK